MNQIVKSEGFKKLVDISKDAVEQAISGIINDYFDEEKAMHNAIIVKTKIESVSETNKSFIEYKNEIEN